MSIYQKNILIIFCLCLPVLANAQSIIPYKSGGKWGYMRTDSTLVTQAKYDTVYRFDYATGIVKLNNKYGYVGNSGNEITPIIYDECTNFRGEFASVKMGNKWGLIDLGGTMLIQAHYDRPLVIPYNKKYVSACLNEKWGLVNLKDKVMVPFEYDYSLYGSYGMFAAIKNEKAGFIDKKGKIIIPFIYSDALDFYSTLAEVRLDSVVGMINKKNEVIIPIEFSTVYELDFGLVEVTKNGLFGLYNTDGIKLVDPVYEELAEFYSGYTILKKGNNVSLVNRHGDKVIEDATSITETDICYDCVLFYFDDMAGVFSAYENRIISKARFDGYMTMEEDETILVELDGKMGLLSFESGELIIQPKYDMIESLDYGCYRVVQNNKQGIADAYGNLLVPVLYQDVWVEGSKYLGAIDDQGNEIYFTFKGERVQLDE